MKEIEFEAYDEKEFMMFLKRLPIKDRQKLIRVVDDIENYGMMVAIQNKWVKKIDDNLFEIRSSLSNNIQRVLYFHVVDNHYVITNAFTKKTQKTPMSEINKGKNKRTFYFEIHGKNQGE